MLGLFFLAGLGSPARGAAKLVHPSTHVQTPAPEKLMIGKAGSRKTYYRIDTGFPFKLRGPGMLTMYVRGHATSAAPESVRVRLLGWDKYGEQSWRATLKPSKTSGFGGTIAGAPTGSKKITMAMPSGIQELTLVGSSHSGDPVYVRMLYDGPPLEAPAGAKPAETPAKKPSPWRISTTVGLQAIYDDNI